MQTKTINPELRQNANSQLRIIFLSGLLVGTLDILSAIIDYSISTGKNPMIIFKFIASGLIGKKAYQGGSEIILLGLFLHYFIAFSFTVFFFFIYPKIALMSKNRIITGIIYGIFIWAVMNTIVLPLSSTPPPAHRTTFKIIKAMVILTVMIGLPLSFIAYNWFVKRRGQK